MRELKFRAWDVKDKEMIDGDSLAFEEYEPLCHSLRDTDRMKYMQFTGLKDKNGVEIYEGDIVSTTKEIDLSFVESKKYSYIRAVKWSQKMCGWIPFTYEEGNRGDEYRFTTYTWEVIGNIYEHPNLLEESK